MYIYIYIYIYIYVNVILYYRAYSMYMRKGTNGVSTNGVAANFMF